MPFFTRIAKTRRRHGRRSERQEERAEALEDGEVETGPLGFFPRPMKRAAKQMSGVTERFTNPRKHRQEDGTYKRMQRKLATYRTAFGTRDQNLYKIEQEGDSFKWTVYLKDGTVYKTGIAATMEAADILTHHYLNAAKRGYDSKKLRCHGKSLGGKWDAIPAGTVADYQSDEYQLVISPEDVDHIKQNFGNASVLADFYGFIVKTGEGEYLEVYGFENSVPYLHVPVYKVVPTGEGEDRSDNLGDERKMFIYKVQVRETEEISVKDMAEYEEGKIIDKRQTDDPEIFEYVVISIGPEMARWRTMGPYKMPYDVGPAGDTSVKLDGEKPKMEVKYKKSRSRKPNFSFGSKEAVERIAEQLRTEGMITRIMQTDQTSPSGVPIWKVEWNAPEQLGGSTKESCELCDAVCGALGEEEFCKEQFKMLADKQITDDELEKRFNSRYGYDWSNKVIEAMKSMKGMAMGKNGG